MGRKGGGKMGKYPVIIQGRISYEIHWDGCVIRGEASIPQSLAQKAMDLIKELDQVNSHCPM